LKIGERRRRKRRRRKKKEGGRKQARKKGEELGQAISLRIKGIISTA
jgi:hypothetical protein